MRRDAMPKLRRPWFAGGTVRFVDSSLERIEVRVTGLNESRYVITVNGRALPLQPTGTAGEFVVMTVDL